MKLTKAEMIKIIRDGAIDDVTPANREQIMKFAFGEDYMKSEDKGGLQIKDDEYLYQFGNYGMDEVL